MHTDLGKIAGSTVLAAPAGWTPAPSIATPVFPVAAPALFNAMQTYMLEQPRTWLTGAHPDQQQAAFIVRSIAMNFPDIVVVQAIPAGDATSKAVIFSQSRYDVWPFVSANGERTRKLIAALRDQFPPPPDPPLQP